MNPIGEIIGPFIYFLGAIIITLPGIAQVETLYSSGKLLRALEKIEISEVNDGHPGFEELRAEINSIVNDENRLGEDIRKLDLHSNTLNLTGPELKIRGHDKQGNTQLIDEPLFLEMRIQLDRTIRRGKTKIRACGIFLTVVGFTVQNWSYVAGILT